MIHLADPAAQNAPARTSRTPQALQAGPIQGGARLERAFDQAPCMLALLSGPEHVFERVNQAFVRFLGRQDLPGRRLREVFPELHTRGHSLWLDRLYHPGRARESLRFPIRVRRAADGMPLVLELIVEPMVEPDGTVSGVLIEGLDLTERQCKEDKLRENERQAVQATESSEMERSRLDALLQAAPVGIIMADVHGKLLRVNAENRRIWGPHPLSQSQAEYRQWKGWWADGGPRHGRSLAADEWAMARALRGEEHPRDIVEIESFGPQPERRTIVNSGRPVRDAEGRIIGAVVAQMDITDRVRAELAARENEAKFRTITEAMPQMVWSTQADGAHDYFNQQWYEYTGASLGATDGQAWLDLFHPDDRAHARARWQHSLDSGEPYEIEYRLRHRSGQYRWALGRALPVRDERGQVVRWMGTCTDIHEQKMAQESLQQTDRRKDEFLAMLAHELRNPLAPIAAAAELLARGKTVTGDGKQLSAVIQRHAAHMSSLVDELLDVSRVTRGLVTLAKVPVDARACVEEALEQVRPLMAAHRHRMQTRLQVGLARVMGEKKRLVQVMANLLSNAVKYTPPGGLIQVELSQQGGQIELGVRDNGIGMSPELLSRAFDLFAQGERTSDRSEGGLGIGLALVRTLVQLHGGQVRAESAGPGRGSVFTVILPCLPQAPPPPAPRRLRSRADTTGKGALRILVVDDNLDAGRLLGMLLQTLGHEVMVEGGALQALAQAPQFQPQVCLLDIGLPGMDGHELARRLRQLCGLQDVWLAAVTGYGQPSDRAAAAAAGFAQYFVKPLDVNQLQAWLAGLRQNALP